MRNRILKTKEEYTQFFNDVIEHHLHRYGSSQMKDIAKLYIENGFSDYSLKRTYKWQHNKETYERPYHIVCVLRSRDLTHGYVYISREMIHFYIKPEHRQQGHITRAFKFLAKRYPLDQKLINQGVGLVAEKLCRRVGVLNKPVYENMCV